ncbi:MAG: MchE protein [Pirellulaceae bacterium]|nr:MchE protein [Pirellulaceae bacterium]
MNARRALWQRRLGNLVLGLLVIAIASGVAGYLYLRWQQDTESQQDNTTAPDRATLDGTMPARVSSEARKNLGVITRAILPTSYYRQIEIPGTIVDRPGVSDRGVSAPVAGVVSRIHTFPGETVQPNTPLFTLRLVSDAIHTAQLELFKATKEIEIARQQRQRLEGLAASGGVPGVRMIELENEIQRLQVTAIGSQQILVARGFSPEQIAAASQGDFVTEITVFAPGETAPPTGSRRDKDDSQSLLQEAFAFELQTLNVALGQQVEAGMVLCVLADHRLLMIEGRGFRKDLWVIQNAVMSDLPIEVVFESNEQGDWPTAPQSFRLAHIANAIDPSSRTFGVYLPLVNQWRPVTPADPTHFMWRYSPGDRVRVFVAVDLMENVFVLPLAAVVREGGEAFVFRQNGDLFDRISVHVLHEDGRNVVIANDGKLRRNSFIAHRAAASLNRILKSQMSSGQATNMHVHADGTVHAAH